MKPVVLGAILIAVMSSGVFAQDESKNAEAAADYERLLSVFPEEHAGRGLDPEGVVDHQPMTYGLVLAAESLRARRTSNEAARRRVRLTARWLIDHRDLNRDGKPGWGLPQTWDAFGDGTTNPAHTSYTITTAIVLEGLIDALEIPQLWTTDELRELRELVRDVLLRWSREMWLDGFGGGYFQYSEQSHDDHFSINAPAMMLSPQARFLTHHAGDLSHEERNLLQRRLDALATAIVKTVQLRDGCPFWDYLPQPNKLKSRRPNDAVHQAYILWGMETYREQGGAVVPTWTRAQAMNSIEKFWRDHQLYFFAQDEPNWSDRAKTQPANLWGSGMVLACYARWGSRQQVSRSRTSLIAAHGPLPKQREYPSTYRDDARFFPRHAAHVLFGLAYAAFGQGQ